MNRPEGHLSFVPPLLPDQTLYSWVAMFHLLSGNISPDETRCQLFNSVKAGRHFHIPTHLTAFCARTQLALGDVHDVVALATVLPFFTRFRSKTVAADAIRLAGGNSASGLPQMLNMGNKWPYWALPRKSCPDCIVRDHENFGLAYWRRAHQLPGVLVCHKHRTTLQVETNMSTHVTSALLAPALGDVSLARAPIRSVDWKKNSTAHRLATIAKDMAETGFDGTQDREALLSSFLRQLAKRFTGSSASRPLDPLALSVDFARHFESVAQAPEIGTIIQQRGTRALWMLLEKAESHAHPLEWMLIIDWLYGDWRTFERSFHAPT